MPMIGAIDFSDLTYTTPDGLVTVALGEMPKATWYNMAVRVLDHVLGNEAASKASTAKAKDASLTKEQLDGIRDEARVKYVSDMMAALWGEKGNRSPRTPGANRLDQIIQMLLAEDTRKAISKAGFKSGDEKNTWQTEDGTVFKLADAMKAYEENAEFGEARMADIRKRAERKHAMEVADAEDRKAAKAREANVSKGPGLSL